MVDIYKGICLSFCCPDGQKSLRKDKRREGGEGGGGGGERSGNSTTLDFPSRKMGKMSRFDTPSCFLETVVKNGGYFSSDSMPRGLGPCHALGHRFSDGYCELRGVQFFFLAGVFSEEGGRGEMRRDNLRQLLGLFPQLPSARS